MLKVLLLISLFLLHAGLVACLVRIHGKEDGVDIEQDTRYNEIQSK